MVIDWGVLAGLKVFCAVLAFSRVRFVRFAEDERGERRAVGGRPRGYSYQNTRPPSACSIGSCTSASSSPPTASLPDARGPRPQGRPTCMTLRPPGPARVHLRPLRTVHRHRHRRPVPQPPTRLTRPLLHSSLPHRRLAPPPSRRSRTRTTPTPRWQQPPPTRHHQGRGDHQDRIVEQQPEGGDFHWPPAGT